jgi:hypothetical protein
MAELLCQGQCSTRFGVAAGNASEKPNHNAGIASELPGPRPIDKDYFLKNIP